MQQKENRGRVEYSLVGDQIAQRNEELQNQYRIIMPSDSCFEDDYTEDAFTKKGKQISNNIFSKSLDFCKEYLVFIDKNWHGICTFSSVFFIITQIVVYFTLKSYRCPFFTDDKCVKQFILPSMAKWLLMITINSSVAIAQLHMFIEKSTYTRYLPGYALVQSLYLFCLNDSTINLHIYIGAMNALHVILFVFFLVVYLVSRAWITIYKKNNLICLLVTLILITLVSYSFYNNKVIHGCDYWTQGINGEIEDKEGTCSIPVPSLCWYKITHYWQDISALLPTCDSVSATSQTKDRITQFFKESVGDSRYIGFANLNQHSEYSRNDEKIQQTVFDSAKGYRTLEDAQTQNHDVILDRERQEYTIDVQFNKTLSEQRKKIADNLKEKPLVKNVLLIFIDSVSRQSMHLKLPKTVAWFEKNAQEFSYKPENQGKQAERNSSQSFEFYKFNSLKPYTFDNLQTFFYGKRVRDVKLSEEEKLESITEEIRNKGYVTGHTSDYCQTLSLGIDEETMNIMKSARYDHETQSFACDPNYYDPESAFSLFQGPYSLVRRCLYGKVMAEYPLEYTKDFFQKYSDNQKFMHLEFMYGHESSGEVLNQLDDPLSSFLNDMTESGLLKDTAVILFNDHGLHMQGIFYILHLQNVFIEINLPGLFINLPEEVNQKYGDKIALNQQNLVSIYNLHHFVQHLINGENYKYEEHSLFNSLDHQKSCQDLNIDEQSCSCH